MGHHDKSAIGSPVSKDFSTVISYTSNILSYFSAFSGTASEWSMTLDILSTMEKYFHTPTSTAPMVAAPCPIFILIILEL